MDVSQNDYFKTTIKEILNNNHKENISNLNLGTHAPRNCPLSSDSGPETNFIVSKPFITSSFVIGTLY